MEIFSPFSSKNNSYAKPEGFFLPSKLIIFEDKVFNTPEEAKWTIDRILELPDEYKGQCLLELGFNLAVLYKHMIDHDPSLDERMKDAYAKWVKEL